MGQTSEEVFSLLFTITSTKIFYSPSPPLEQSGLKLVCNVKIEYGHLKSENSQDNAQKHQRNCSFMNSASAQRPQHRVQATLY
jgi:hypothetical protein